MQATHYSETSVLTIATRRRILENGIPKCQWSLETSMTIYSHYILLICIK
jgi:hypothetical protein